MTRRISPFVGALDAIFLGNLSKDQRTLRDQDETWRPERKRRMGPVSPMRRHRFCSDPET